MFCPEMLLPLEETYKDGLISGFRVHLFRDIAIPRRLFSPDLSPSIKTNKSRILGSEMTFLYKDIKKEWSIFWEQIVSVIVGKYE
jgi:hypothetical protein